MTHLLCYYIHDTPLMLLFTLCYILTLTLNTIPRVSFQSTPPIEEDSWRHRRLRSELKTLRTDPPEGIQATPLDRHCCHWQASITGPHGSPYEGGLFLLYLQIPHRFVALSTWKSLRGRPLSSLPSDFTQVCSTVHMEVPTRAASFFSTFRFHTGL